MKEFNKQEIVILMSKFKFRKENFSLINQKLTMVKQPIILMQIPKKLQIKISIMTTF